MFPPKEIAQNLVLGIGPVRRWAQGRHESTGLNRLPDRVADIYAFYRRHAEVSGQRILELGIGHTPDVLLKALDDGAASASAADIAGYFTPRTGAERRIDFRLYDGRRLPFGDRSFDLVWSSNVFQHLREPAALVQEIRRVIAPGGRLLVRADLRDHYHLQDPERWLDCLRYPDWLWNAMTSNRSAYVNRLRLSDWRKLLEGSGFRLEAIEVARSPELLEQRAGRDWLGNLADDDLTATGFDAVWSAL